ncbi:MAG TPA: restriction endonuclease subunit S [Desulfobacteria bacterium]|nr:restriction endonuclease subunit S [Desulfobacteria bacterium]
MISNFGIETLFELKTGDFHATKELDKGTIPLISCGETNNGLVGFFGIPDEKRYSNTITVAYNGRPLTAKYHPYIFGAKDDVAVLLPINPLREETLIYIATLFDLQTWRYSYGRKCFKDKLKRLSIPLPVSSTGDIDENYIKNLLKVVRHYLPKKREIEPQTFRDLSLKFNNVHWEIFVITDLFNLNRGDFHAISNLEKGDISTVSRVSDNNGIVGYYSQPENAKIYQPPLITVSTVTGDAFVQIKEFIATDNVVICIPKESLRITTLFFIQAMINQAKWRYSYGRQCYKTKFAQTKIYLPIKEPNVLDEDFMEETITNTSYWDFVKEYLEH